MKQRRTYQDWLLTPHRLALHLPTKTAVIADVHLGYAESRQRNGDAVPASDSESVCADLAMAWQSYPFTRLVVAGDLFERRAEPELLAPLLSWCQVQDVEFLGLTPGNHDRGLEAVPELPLWPDGFELGNWRVVHEPTTAGERWICGHWHPCVRVGGKRVPCYVVGALGLILPAFSRDAAGVDVETLALPEGSITIPAIDLLPAKPAAGRLLRALRERQR